MPPTTRQRQRPPRLRGYLARTNLVTSVALVFPLFLAYQVAVISLPGVYNGADLITAQLIALLNHSTAQYLLVNVALTLAFVLLVLLLHRRQQFDLRRLVPVLLESGIYALSMGALIVNVMGLVGIDPTLRVAAAAAPVAHGAGRAGLPTGILERLALAFGAGVHEELVFRLVLLTATVALVEKVLGARRAVAVAVGFVVTAVLFSAAHHVVGGEPWRVGAFVYRLFCGLVFAALYQWRGFAIAVYTHALYDVYVMVIQ